MVIRLDATVLDEARRIGGHTSDDKLGAAIGMSGAAIRDLRHGRRTPSTTTLVKLRQVTGRPIDNMLIRVPDSTPGGRQKEAGAA